MGLHEETCEKLVTCIQEKVRLGELPFGSAVNPNRVGEMCGADSRTVENHWPKLIGTEVEGSDFRGRIKPARESAGPWGVIEPPSDNWIERPTQQSQLADLETGAVVALGVTGLALAVWGLCRILNRQPKPAMVTFPGPPLFVAVNPQPRLGTVVFHGLPSPID